MTNVDNNYINNMHEEVTFVIRVLRVLDAVRIPSLPNVKSRKHKINIGLFRFPKLGNSVIITHTLSKLASVALWACSR